MPNLHTLLTRDHPHVLYHLTVGQNDAYHFSCIEQSLNKLSSLHPLPTPLTGSSARISNDLSLLLLHLLYVKEQVLGQGYRLIH